MAVSEQETREAMLFARQLIHKGMEGLTGEKERYEYITRRCLQAPFLALSRSQEDKRVWTNQRVNIKDAVGSFLPADVYDNIEDRSHKEKNMQDVMDLTTFKDFGFTTIFSNTIHSHAELVDLIHIDVPDTVTSVMKIYYIRFEAKYNGERSYGFVQVTDRELKATYRKMEFSALTSVLLKVKEKREQGVMEDTMKWAS